MLHDSGDSPVDRVRTIVSAACGLLKRTDTQAVAQRAAAVALMIRVGNAALAYVAQVVLARLMGQFEFGVFAYTWVWFMVFAALATLGFGDSPIRFIAQLRERGETEHLRGFIRFAPVAILVTSIAAGAVVLAVLPLAGPWIGTPYVLPLALMALCLPFACLQSFLEGVGRSYGWTVPALLPVYILRHGLLLVFMVIAVAAGFEASAVNGFVCVVLTLVVSLVYQTAAILLRLRRVLQPGPHAYRPREWVRGSAPFSILYGSAYLSSFSDVLVLSFFVSPAEIAIYFAATRIIQVVLVVPYAAMVGTAHLFSASHTRGDHDELQRLCRHVSVTTFLVSGLAVALILALGEWLLGMFGEGFSAGYVPLAILAASVVARVVAGPAEDVLNMTGHGSISASTYLLTVLVSIPLNVALVVPFGIVGAAIGSAVALTGRAAWLSYSVRRRLGIDTSIFAAIPSGARWDGFLARRSALQEPAE
jgi:O-antigen/teichoic acid export membrane protein